MASNKVGTPGITVGSYFKSNLSNRLASNLGTKIAHPPVVNGK